MPKIDFSKQLYNSNGEIAEHNMKVDSKVPLTLGFCAIMALNSPLESDKNCTPEDVFKRGKLSTRIRLAKEPIDISTTQRDLIKERVSKSYLPDIVFQAHNLLEEKEQFCLDEEK